MNFKNYHSVNLNIMGEEKPEFYLKNKKKGIKSIGKPNYYNLTQVKKAQEMRNK
mgnify:CR=1 FL=1